MLDPEDPSILMEDSNYAGKDKKQVTFSEGFMSAAAIRYMSASEPSRLKLFSAHNIIRQLSCVYPPAGSMRSTLGDMFLFLYPTLLAGSEKGMSVNSQRPVHRTSNHSGVRSKSILFFLARCLIPGISVIHG